MNKKTIQKKPSKSKGQKHEPNYRIIRLEETSSNSHKKITMIKFYAEDDDEAYDKLVEYKKAANKAYTYYIDSYQPIRVFDEKTGKVKTYEDHNAWIEADRKQTPWYKKLWDSVSWWCWQKWADKLSDFKYWIADILYFIKHKQYRRASWSLDSYILDTIVHNVKILMTSKHGISQPFIDEARKELHKHDKEFDLAEYNKEHFNITEEEEKKALEIQNSTYQQILDAICKYNYYSCHGVADDEETDKKLRSTLPIIKGSYDMFDYKKLHALAMKQWNFIWEWMRKYAQTLWD